MCVYHILKSRNLIFFNDKRSSLQEDYVRHHNTQHNDIQHKGTQNNDIQHYITQHNNK
jgi:hypothetical protein